MKKLNPEHLIEPVVNLIWFGIWLYIIFGLHQSGWWILVPIFLHWTPVKPTPGGRISKDIPTNKVPNKAEKGKRIE